jgi:hypothetical protein
MKDWRKERKKDMNDRRDMQETETKEAGKVVNNGIPRKGGRVLKPTRTPSLRETGNANRITVPFPESGVPVDKNSTGYGNTFTYTGITFHIHR